ncbi:MAG: hypothetical protein R3A11_07660 [Bdellovibrionota bacterium]
MASRNHKMIGARILISGLLSLPAISWAENLAQLRSEYQIKRHQLMIQEEKLQSIEHSLSNYQPVASHTQTSMVKKIPNQTKLKEMESLSQQLEEQRVQLQKHRDDLAITETKLLKTLQGQIDQLTANIQGQNVDEEQSRQHGLEIKKLYEEKENISKQIYANVSPVPLNISLDPTQNESELREQIAAVEDLSQHIRTKLKELETLKVQKRKKMFLMKEVAHLLNEEQFFGEKNFSSNSAARRNNGNLSIYSSTVQKGSEDVQTGPSSEDPLAAPGSDPTPTSDVNPQQTDAAAAPTTGESISVDHSFHPRKGIDSVDSQQWVEFSDASSMNDLDHQMDVYRDALKKLSKQKQELNLLLSENARP